MIGFRKGSVRLVPYRAEWKELFEEEAARLRPVLGEKVLCVEHVGSTAVEGMEAKPLIDMVAAVESLDEARGLVPVLEGLGYEHRGSAGVEGRIFFARGPRNRRTHHLSLAEPTSEHWRRSLLFRDHLRAYPEVAEAYRELKRELARKYPEDRESYTAGKDRFVGQVIDSTRTDRKTFTEESTKPVESQRTCWVSRFGFCRRQEVGSMQPWVRPFDDQDTNALVDLSLRTWAPAFASLEQVMGPEIFRRQHPDWREDQRRAVEDVCAANKGRVWVAEVGARAVGFVAVELHHPERSMGEISMLAVDPDYQGGGIGTALTDFALDRLRDAGMTVAMVETGGDPGHAAARRTYEKAGYILLPIARYFKNL